MKFWAVTPEFSYGTIKFVLPVPFWSIGYLFGAPPGPRGGEGSAVSINPRLSDRLLSVTKKKSSFLFYTYTFLFRCKKKSFTSIRARTLPLHCYYLKILLWEQFNSRIFTLEFFFYTCIYIYIYCYLVQRKLFFSRKFALELFLYASIFDKFYSKNNLTHEYSRSDAFFTRVFINFFYLVQRKLFFSRKFGVKKCSVEFHERIDARQRLQRWSSVWPKRRIEIGRFSEWAGVSRYLTCTRSASRSVTLSAIRNFARIHSTRRTHRI